MCWCLQLKSEQFLLQRYLKSLVLFRVIYFILYFQLYMNIVMQLSNRQSCYYCSKP